MRFACVQKHREIATYCRVSLKCDCPTPLTAIRRILIVRKNLALRVKKEWMPRTFIIPQYKLNRRGLARFFGSLEARVMEVVWKRETATVQEVCAALGKGANYKTVMTVMNRLAEKGLLERNRVSRAFVYSPRVPREEFVHRVSHQIVAGLVSEFGQVAVAQFVDVLDELDPAALETLRHAIQERTGPPR